MAFQRSNEKRLLLFQDSGRSLRDWQQTFTTSDDGAFKVGVISPRVIDSAVVFRRSEGPSVDSETCILYPLTSTGSHTGSEDWKTENTYFCSPNPHPPFCWALLLHSASRAVTRPPIIPITQRFNGLVSSFDPSPLKSLTFSPPSSRSRLMDPNPSIYFQRRWEDTNEKWKNTSGKIPLLLGCKL